MSCGGHEVEFHPPPKIRNFFDMTRLEWDSEWYFLYDFERKLLCKWGIHHQYFLACAPRPLSYFYVILCGELYDDLYMLWREEAIGPLRFVSVHFGMITTDCFRHFQKVEVQLQLHTCCEYISRMFVLWINKTMWIFKYFWNRRIS